MSKVAYVSLIDDTGFNELEGIEFAEYVVSAMDIDGEVIGKIWRGTDFDYMWEFGYKLSEKYNVSFENEAMELK